MENVLLTFKESFRYGMQFGSNLMEVHDGLKQVNDTLSLEYVSTVSRFLTPSYVGITLLNAFQFLSIPANLLIVLVIIRNKNLWTASNMVLSINAVIQAIGSAIYLITRSLWHHSFLLVPMSNNYKETVYLIGWWTYSIMMRTGNNR